MNVHDNDFAGHLLQQLIGLAKRIVVGLHEDAALQVDDRILLAGFGCAFEYAHAGNAVRVVGGPQHAAGAGAGIPVGRIEVLDDLALVPDVVPGGQHVTAQIEEVFGDGRGQTKSAGSIFRIGDHQIDLVGLDQMRHMVVDDLASSAAEDVADEENLNG